MFGAENQNIDVDQRRLFQTRTKKIIDAWLIYGANIAHIVRIITIFPFARVRLAVIKRFSDVFNVICQFNSVKIIE